MKRLIRALRHPHDYPWWELRPWQRHSLVLAVAGFVYVAFGTVLIATDPTRERLIGLKLGLKLFPLDAWGSAWIVVGFLALTSARWPPASKTWGYSALTGLAACWSALYGLGVLFLGTPVGGISAALVWALVAFLWWAIAGLANPDDVIAMVDEGMGRDSSISIDDLEG